MVQRHGNGPKILAILRSGPTCVQSAEAASSVLAASAGAFDPMVTTRLAMTQELNGARGLVTVGRVALRGTLISGGGTCNGSPRVSG
jgi:hypothetical protein